MEKDYDYLCKVLLIGNSSVGKSALMERYVDNTFTPHFVSTIGVDYKVKRIKINDKNVKITIWDTAGQERFRTITSVYYNGSHGIIIVFDLTDRSSFKNLNDWLHEIDRYARDKVKLLLIGNKSDLIDKRKVSFEEASKYAEQMGFEYIETSAKNNTNIDNVFISMSQNIIKDIPLNNKPNNIKLVPEDKIKNNNCC